jgi:hypothetical protein
VSRRAPTFALALTLALAFAFSSTAHAYVRSRTQHGTPVYWPGGCVFVQPDSGGTPDLDSTTVFDTIMQSIGAWQSVTADCAYLKINYVDPAPLEAHLDGKNVVKFRTDQWCHPNDSQNHDVCYDAAAAAITTVFYLDRPGQSQDGYIIDADIELNDINFTFVTVVVGQPLPTGRAGTSIADLANTLTHELGHLQGLDHTCKDAATPSNEVDDTGQPPPDCNDLQALPLAERVKITEATMFNSATPGETKKRTPEADDIAGVCAAYPIADAAKHSSCKPTKLSDYSTGGCELVPGRGGGAALAVALGLCLALIAIRARRRQGVADRLQRHPVGRRLR